VSSVAAVAVPAGVVMRPDELLSRHTALRTGGQCEAFVVVHRQEALAVTLATLKERGWKVTLLGAGTRTVARDGEIKGAVLRLGMDFSKIQRQGEGWEVGAAVPMPALIATLAAAGQSGLEHLTGLPGTLGAALALDDGPPGGWDKVLVSVYYLHRGKIRTGPLLKARRGSAIITGALLRLGPGDPEELRTQVRARLREVGRLTCSWYQTPPKETVHALLKGAEITEIRLRSVAVPRAAPEMLVNLGQGTAHDLALLFRSVVDKVQRMRGVELRPQVRWLGSRGRTG